MGGGRGGGGRGGGGGGRGTLMPVTPVVQRLPEPEKSM